MNQIGLWNKYHWKMEIITCLKRVIKFLQSSIISNGDIAAKVAAGTVPTAMIRKRIPINLRGIRHDI